MTNERNQFTEALRLASQAIRDAAPHIDELNGRLEELENYTQEIAKLSDGSLDTMRDTHELYMHLPVWDTLRELAFQLDRVRDELLEEGREE